MTSTYVEITLEEMRACLPKDKGWHLLIEFGTEHVFGWNIPSCPGLMIKVYTSIKKKDAVGRGKGKDAIRVACVLYKDGDKMGVVRAERVYRTINWRDNLRKRVIATLEQARDRYQWALKTFENNHPSPE
tara:strand:+ start:164 stop:553 length:390 start_codon:yes stop_codon:yes gene_type:complete